MNRIHQIMATVAGTFAATGMLAVGAALPAGASPAAPAAPAAAVRAAAPAYSAPTRSLHVGMKGSDVKALQERLAALKYYPGSADGQFGTNTEEAVWAFQEVQGIGADGTVGSSTGRALVNPSAYSARYSSQATRVEVNLSRRVLVLYRNHAVALISHVSAGGGYHYCDKSGCSTAITPTGNYRTNGYAPGWITVPLGRMYNSVFFIGRAYAIHGDTYVPLAPVSHGCIRIPMDIAAFFHNMVSSYGTPVHVYW